MRVVVLFCEVAELPDFATNRPWVPGLVLSRFVEAGSYARVVDYSGAYGSAEASNATFSVLSEYGAIVEMIDSLPEQVLGGSGIAFVSRTWSMSEGDSPDARWLERMVSDHVVSALITEAGRPKQSMVVFLSEKVPCMGRLESCSIVDVQRTWLNLVGRLCQVGRYLLEEAPSTLDSRVESVITQRLRHLYGE